MQYQSRPSYVEAFQVTFPIEIKHPHSPSSMLCVGAGSWIVRSQKGEIEVLSNEEFNTEYVASPKTPIVRSPSIAMRTITPEDIDFAREI
jgi:hypothetical protein